MLPASLPLSDKPVTQGKLGSEGGEIGNKQSFLTPGTLVLARRLEECCCPPPPGPSVLSGRGLSPFWGERGLPGGAEQVPTAITAQGTLSRGTSGQPLFPHPRRAGACGPGADRRDNKPAWGNCLLSPGVYYHTRQWRNYIVNRCYYIITCQEPPANPQGAEPDPSSPCYTHKALRAGRSAPPPLPRDLGGQPLLPEALLGTFP